MLADRVDHLRRIEIGIEHARAALGRGQQADADARDVVGRQHVQHHVRRAAVADRRRDRTVHEHAQVLVRELDALRQPGGARGIQLQRGVPHRRRAARIDRVERPEPVAESRRFADPALRDEAVRERRRAHRAHHLEERGVSHHQARLAVVDDVLDLARREAPVHRHAHRADLAGGEREHDALGRVLGQAGHAHALADAKGTQPLRRAVRGLLELRETPAARWRQESERIGLRLRLPAHRVDQRVHRAPPRLASAASLP